MTPEMDRPRPREEPVRIPAGAVVLDGDLALPSDPVVVVLFALGSGNSPVVLMMNQDALSRLRVEKRLIVVPGATHLFEEPGALAEVARLARDWFVEHLAPPGLASAGGEEK